MKFCLFFSYRQWWTHLSLHRVIRFDLPIKCRITVFLCFHRLKPSWRWLTGRITSIWQSCVKIWRGSEEVMEHGWTKGLHTLMSFGTEATFYACWYGRKDSVFVFKKEILGIVTFYNSIMYARTWYFITRQQNECERHLLVSLTNMCLYLLWRVTDQSAGQSLSSVSVEPFSYVCRGQCNNIPVSRSAHDNGC